ncbi:MAG: phosphate ABC transporter substrate-binding/OmpA family protein [Pseudomonadota bacterium]
MQARNNNTLKRLLPLFAVLLGLMIWHAKPASAFDIAVGNEQSGTFKLGIGISSLVKIKLLPRYDIDLEPLITEGDEASLKALEDGVADFALVAVDQSQPLSRIGMEAVANLGELDNLTTMLVAAREVDGEAVQRILVSIFENVNFLSAIDPQLSGINPDKAVMGLTLPLHRGAKRYLASRWASGGDVAAAEPAAAVEEVTAAAAPAPAASAAPEVETAALPPAYGEEADDARNYVFYFGFDDASLNPESQATLERAARFAESLEDPAIIVAAYTDSAGDAEYNYLLAERRAASVVDGLEALQVRYSQLDLSLFGERSPWAVTLDNVNEASNRRVELFIEEPVPEIQPLPIPASYTQSGTAGAITADGVSSVDGVSGADRVTIEPSYVPARPAASAQEDGSGLKRLPQKPLM